MDIEIIKELAGSDPVVIGGESYPINKTNVKKYTIAKMKSEAKILSDFRNSRRINAAGEGGEK